MVMTQKRHGMRPAHIHFLISAPGYRELVTALYMAGDEHLEDDVVFGASGDLVADGPIEILGSGVGGSGVNNGGGTGGTGTASGGSGALARTGFSSTPMITLGAAVLVLGAAAVYGSKRRRAI